MSHTTWPNAWSQNFSLGGVPSLSMQFVGHGVPCQDDSQSCFRNVVKFRGPDGYFLRLKIMYGGKQYEQAHATPLWDTGIMDAGTQLTFSSDERLPQCLRPLADLGSRSGNCSAFTLQVLERRYV